MTWSIMLITDMGCNVENSPMPCSGIWILFSRQCGTTEELLSDQICDLEMPPEWGIDYG